MNHLAGLDAAFLYAETAETPMHVGSLNVYELPPGYDGEFVEDVRRHLAGRFHLAPVFKRKLLNMPFELANPVWVLDEHMDIEYHVRSTVLPRPGSREQLDKLIGRLHSSQLDRSRPLWEVVVIEGLQSPPGAPKGTRHVGLYTKVHHASIDGAAGVAFAAVMTDPSPVPRQLRLPSPHHHGLRTDNIGIAELTVAGIGHMAGQYLKLARSLPTLVRSAIKVLRPARGAAQGSDTPAHWFGPRTLLNVNITNQRSFTSLSIPFAEARQVAKAHGVTLNDVVLAICAGALRRYLAEREDLPAEPLLAGVPVSLREAGNTDPNNQSSMMRVGLATDVADPIERLLSIHRASIAAKAQIGTLRALPTDFPSLGAPWLISGLAALYGRSHLADRMPPPMNLIISNVPGPQTPLYLAGAKMLSYYPLNIPAHGVALNMTVESYAGSLDFGLIACRRALPDVDELGQHLLKAHRELLARMLQELPMPAAPTQRATPAGRAARKATAAKTVRTVPAKTPRKRRASAAGARLQ